MDHITQKWMHNYLQLVVHLLLLVKVNEKWQRTDKLIEMREDCM